MALIPFGRALTVANLGQRSEDGTYRRIPLCPECVDVWHREPDQRELLLAEAPKKR